MRSLLWLYLGSRRFPREMSTFEVRRFFRFCRNKRVLGKLTTDFNDKV
jgi:hypothetical protein